MFRGAYLETDYASFAAWKSWGRPPAGVHDCFAAAAILSADGAFLLGLMGPHTLNAGLVYFPCGTPDPSDISGDKVDLEFSVRRELKEETGLGPEQFREQPGWTAVFDGALIAQVKLFRSDASADALRARIVESLAAEREPELADIRIVRGPADLSPAMPRFVRAFIEYHWRGP